MTPTNTITLTLTAITLTLLINGCDGSSGGAKEDNNTHGLLNTPPVAKNLTVNLDEDTIKNMTLIATDEDKDPLSYKITKQPSNGKLQGTPPNITYIPNQDYNGKDSFTYIANDKKENSNEAKVDITINPINDKPIAKDDKITLKEDNNKTINPLTNDTDIDGDTLTIKSYTNPTNGKVIKTANNKLIYTPNKDYNGKDSFTYTITDGNETAKANITLTITPVNDAPVAKELNATLNENETANIKLIATDIDSQKLTYKITKQPSNGKLQGTPPNITYIPNKEFFGKDSFTYIATDDKGAESKEAKVDLTIEQTAIVKNLELNVEKLSLNKGTSTKLKLTPTLSKGKVTQKLKDAIANPEFLVTPKDAIKIDYKTKTITALKDTNVTIQAKIANTLSNPVKLNIYWEVDGHRLPPEPDPKINNSTLLGVDSNNNGVRDDVERWIYEKYKDRHPINAVIAMEAAKVYQKIIAHPERAKELLLESRTIGYCEAFLQYNSNPKIKAIFPHEVDDKYFRRTIIFNTEERKKNYEIYAYLLSGSVFSSGTDEEWRNACKHYPKIWKMIKEIEK